MLIVLTVATARRLFLEVIQKVLPTALIDGPRDDLEQQGILLSEVLIRDITLPSVIVQVIEQQK